MNKFDTYYNKILLQNNLNTKLLNSIDLLTTIKYGNVYIDR